MKTLPNKFFNNFELENGRNAIGSFFLVSKCIAITVVVMLFFNDIAVSQTVTLSSVNPAVAAANLNQNTLKQPVYSFNTAVSVANATINTVTFTSTGSYLIADINKFQLWYNTSNNIGTATKIGSDITTALGTGGHSFTALTQLINSGITGYFWITVDVAATPTTGNTLTVNAITTVNLTFSSGTKSGTTSNGGVQTFQMLLDSDGDGIFDIYDLDDDNDGIPDNIENLPCNTPLTELFPNSNFSLGNTGFISSYLYTTGTNAGYPEGTYTISNNPRLWHDQFSACGDHTTGTGNMMVINANTTAGAVVWSSGSITISPFKDYTLSLYLCSVNPASPAQLIFRINGVNIGTQFNALNVCNWIHAQTTWNSGNLTTSTFEIINLNTAAGGNDFALDDISCTYLADCDSDGDGIPDRLDLDSDNDGIYDVVEAGGTDANNDGKIDGFTDVDADGLSDNVDNINSGHGGTEVTSGTPLPNADTDGDGIENRIDLDSDGDGCKDVLEAGFVDANGDGRLGNSPIVVDSKGKVVGYGGYTKPADVDVNAIFDFLQKGPTITVQPANKNVCLTGSPNTSFTVTETNTNSYQWQVSTNNGTTWTTLTNTGKYSNVTTKTLTITGVTALYDGYLYRVQLSHPAYICSPFNSNPATLRVHAALPSVPGAITGFATTCPVISSSYSITSDPNVVTYNWAMPTGWTISSGSGSALINAISGSAGQNGNISVTATNSCGTTAASLLAVVVTVPSPSYTVVPGANCCVSSDVTYTTQPGKSNYLWTLPGTLGTNYTISSGGTSPTDNTVTVKWLTAGSKMVSVNYTNGGCAGVAASTTTMANSLPSPTLTGAATYCSNSTGNTFSTAVGMTNYLWTVTGGAITSGGTLTSNYVTVTWGIAGIGHVKINFKDANTCTAAVPFDKLITISPLPVTGPVYHK